MMTLAATNRLGVDCHGISCGEYSGMPLVAKFAIRV